MATSDLIYGVPVKNCLVGQIKNEPTSQPIVSPPDPFMMDVTHSMNKSFYNPLSKVIAFLLLVSSVLSFSTSGSFWRQLQTFGWQKEKAVVETRSLEITRGALQGKVRFRFSDGTGFSDDLFILPGYIYGNSDLESEMLRLAPGSRIFAFRSPDNRSACLYHFSRLDNAWMFVKGICWLGLAIRLLRPGTKSASLQGHAETGSGKRGQC